jgi:hypothetical protein
MVSLSLSLSVSLTQEFHIHLEKFLSPKKKKNMFIFTEDKMFAIVGQVDTTSSTVNKLGYC